MKDYSWVRDILGGILIILPFTFLYNACAKAEAERARKAMSSYVIRKQLEPIECFEQDWANTHYDCSFEDEDGKYKVRCQGNGECVEVEF